jgi:hypothetical protein
MAMKVSLPGGVRRANAGRETVLDHPVKPVLMGTLRP